MGVMAAASDAEKALLQRIKRLEHTIAHARRDLAWAREQLAKAKAAA
jgi:ribosome-binding protein aMBF1 (putative translation factor)